jgi:spermidine synthase
MDNKATEQVRLFRAGVLVCFFSSGIASLMLEVVWARILGTVFGNTVLASSTVLTAFMLGLAIGGIVIGKRVDRCARPLLLYGLLEIGIGLYALLFPWITGAGSSFYIWFYRAYASGYWTLNGVRLGLSLLFLLPPTILMGGTLPVLTRHLGTGRAEPGREVGYLYSVNTWGGVAGCLLAGFFLLEALGVNGSLYAAGTTALAVGLLAVTLGCLASKQNARVPARHPADGRAAAKAPAASPANYQLVVAAFAVTGACSLACEVLWTRILLFVLGTTVYAFAVMLSTFLIGLALGASASTRWLVPRVRRPLAWFGGLEILVGLATLLSVFLLARLGSIHLGWSQEFHWAKRWNFAVAWFADAAVVLLVPTFLMGMVFPVVTTCLLRGEPALGRRLGQAYGANTVGCVLGSLGAGFILLPVLGTHMALLVVVGLSLAVGLLLLWRTPGRRGALRWGLMVACVGVIGIAFWCTPSDLFWEVVNTYHAPSKLSFVREHSTGTVTVHELDNGDRLVAVDGVDVAGLDFMLRTTQKLQGYLPLCLHPNPRRLVQIGFGSGETARVGMEFGVPEYTVVDICPAIFEAAQFFSEINHGSGRDPRIRRTIMDGKNFALLSGEKFDLIMNDSIFPGSSGSSALYTYDHFLHCRERLAAGGLFSCWVPLDLRASELRMILKSFQQVFPHTSLWVASNCLNKHGLILGSLEPLQIDFARVAQVMDRPTIKRDLAEIAILDVYDLLDCFVCDETAIRQTVAGSPINSDDRPRLEFSCARRMPWKARLLQTLAMLTVNHSPVSACVTNMPQPEANRAEMARRFEATAHILRALVQQLARNPMSRRQEMDLALKCIPGHHHVKQCDAELEQEIRDLRQTLEKYPRSTTVSAALADKLFLALRYDEAAALDEWLLQVDSAPPPHAFTDLARIQFSRGESRVAEQTLLKCLVRWPGAAEAHDLLGGIYLKAGRFEDARRHNEQAVRLEPGNQIYADHYALVRDRK